MCTDLGRHLFNVALAVVDQVALAMGISAGRTWGETVEYAVEQAARQVPDALRDEWEEVARRVVVSLVTTDVETVPYLLPTAQGPEWRVQRFRLLYLHYGGATVRSICGPPRRRSTSSWRRVDST